MHEGCVNCDFFVLEFIQVRVRCLFQSAISTPTTFPFVWRQYTCAVGQVCQSKVGQGVELKATNDDLGPYECV